MPPAHRFVACRFSIYQYAIRVQQPSAVFSRFFLFHAIPEPFQFDFYLLSEKFHHDFSSQRNDHSNRGNHIDSCKKDRQQQPIQHTEAFFSLPLLLCCNFPSRLSFSPCKKQNQQECKPQNTDANPSFQSRFLKRKYNFIYAKLQCYPQKAAKYRLDIHSFSVLYTLPSVYRNERNKQRFSLCRRHTHMNLCIAL